MKYRDNQIDRLSSARPVRRSLVSAVGTFALRIQVRGEAGLGLDAKGWQAGEGVRSKDVLLADEARALRVILGAQEGPHLVLEVALEVDQQPGPGLDFTHVAIVVEQTERAAACAARHLEIQDAHVARRRVRHSAGALQGRIDVSAHALARLEQQQVQIERVGGRLSRAEQSLPPRQQAPRAVRRQHPREVCAQEWEARLQGAPAFMCEDEGEAPTRLERAMSGLRATKREPSRASRSDSNSTVGRA